MINIILSNLIIINNLPIKIKRKIKKDLKFLNPKYLEIKKYSSERGFLFYKTKIKEFLYSYVETKNDLKISRGYLDNLLLILKNENLNYKLQDNRRFLKKINYNFNGNLKEYQNKIIKSAIKKDFGTIIAPCGSGKTIMALYIICKRKQPTIIIVHTKELLDQWIDRIKQYTNILTKEIGVIGNNKNIIKNITVGMVQTLQKRNLIEISKNFGQLIIDECHHIPSNTFLKIINHFDSYYMLGLSATPYRRDKLDKLIFSSIGNISGRITNNELEAYDARIKPEIVIRKTEFYHEYKNIKDRINVINNLIKNKERNELIISDIIKEYNNLKTYSLVLSDRKEHCLILSDFLKLNGIYCEILFGDKNKKDRRKIIELLENKKIRIIIATGNLAGEGLDIPHFNRLFITTPINWRGRVEQYVGRILRFEKDKIDAKVYDYVDYKINILYGVYLLRKKGVYKNYE